MAEFPTFTVVALYHTAVPYSTVLNANYVSNSRTAWTAAGDGGGDRNPHPKKAPHLVYIPTWQLLLTIQQVPGDNGRQLHYVGSLRKRPGG